MANVTMQRLKRLGYEVTIKTDSKDALALFRSQPNHFDLVITDQTMPKMTGEQMVREMMTIRKNLPVILCTGYSSKMDPEKAKEMGISAFLLKPVDKTILSKTIREVLDSQ
jgi:CheY-like chemotaxis protein